MCVCVSVFLCSCFLIHSLSLLLVRFLSFFLFFFSFFLKILFVRLLLSARVQDKYHVFLPPPGGLTAGRWLSLSLSLSLSSRVWWFLALVYNYYCHNFYYLSLFSLVYRIPRSSSSSSVTHSQTQKKKKILTCACDCANEPWGTIT